MGIGLQPHDYGAEFEGIKQPIIVNDLPSLTTDDRLAGDKLLTTRYNADQYSTLPQCDCGVTYGTYQIGMQCMACNTPVKDLAQGGLTSRVWIRSPNGIERLMAPLALYRLDTTLRHGKDFSYVRWAIDPYYNVGNKHADLDLHLLLKRGIQRSYNFFIKNLEQVLTWIWEHICYTRGIDKRRASNPQAELHSIEATMWDVISLTIEEKEQILHRHIALPDRTMNAMESTATGTYVEPVIGSLISAFKVMRGVDTATAEMISGRQAERRTVQALLHLADYYAEYYDQVLGGKPGAFRRTIYGTRTVTSMRAVITALTDPHAYDELHLPWGASIVVWQLHIANKLYARGYGPHDVFRLLHEAHHEINPIIDKIMTEIFNEAGGFFYVYWNRNPSLTRGSYLCMRATRVKRAIRDYSIGHPCTNIESLNADYDGDQMSLRVAMDKREAAMIQALVPSYSVGGTSAPRTLSGQLQLPRPVMVSMANWYKTGGEETVTPEQIQYTQALCE
jgi:hypothetical protein